MAFPVLKRFDVTVLKNKSGSDQAQVPASTTIHFYRQGATVKVFALVPDSSTLPDPVVVTVQVFHTGSIKIGDTVQLDVLSAKVMSVVGVDAVAKTIDVTNYTGNSITLQVPSRLVPTNDRPSIYRDPLGTIAYGTSIPTVAGTGRAIGYVREYRYDYIIAVSAGDLRLYVDAVGSLVMR